MSQARFSSSAPMSVPAGIDQILESMSLILAINFPEFVKLAIYKYL
jgi:hypothetical protein